MLGSITGSFKAGLRSFEGVDTSLLLLFDPATYTSGNTYTEESSYEKTLTLYNSPTHNTDYFSFNGTDQYIQIPNSPGPFSDFSNGISILAFADFGDTGAAERIIDIGGGQSSNNIIMLRAGSGTALGFHVHNTGGDGSHYFTFGSAIANNQWGFYAITANGSQIKLYNQTSSKTITSSVLPHFKLNRNSNFLGKSNWPADAYFDSKMGPVAVYNRALSDGEIENFYNRYRNRYGMSTWGT